MYLACLHSRINSAKSLMARKQDKIYFTPDLWFGLALKQNTSKRNFHQLRLDHSQCHPAGFSYQSVQWGYEIVAQLGDQRVFSAQLCLYSYAFSSWLPLTTTTTPSPAPPSPQKKLIKQMSTQSVISEKPNTWKETYGKLCLLCLEQARSCLIPLQQDS